MRQTRKKASLFTLYFYGMFRYIVGTEKHTKDLKQVVL